MDYRYRTELDRECRAQRERWNGKEITTSRQWIFNDHGSAEIAGSSLNGITYAVMEGLGISKREAENYLSFV